MLILLQQVLTGDLEPSIQQWTTANSRLPLRGFVQSLGPPSAALEEFLVRVQPETTEALPASAPPPAPAANVESAQNAQQDVEVGHFVKYHKCNMLIYVVCVTGGNGM